MIGANLYMETLKVLEWNINQRAKDTKNQDYVVTEIKDKDPDIAVLVEFRGEETKKLIYEGLQEEYFINSYEIAEFDDNGNEILVALKQSKFNEPTSNNISYPDTYLSQNPVLKEIIQSFKNSKWNKVIKEYPKWENFTNNYSEWKKFINSQSTWKNFIDQHSDWQDFIDTYPDWQELLYYIPEWPDPALIRYHQTEMPYFWKVSDKTNYAKFVGEIEWEPQEITEWNELIFDYTNFKEFIKNYSSWEHKLRAHPNWEKLLNKQPGWKQFLNNYQTWGKFIYDFPNISEFTNLHPDWLKINATLLTGETLDIMGMRVRYDKVNTTAGFFNRKAQINWILSQQNNSDKQIILGDLNFGPHDMNYIEEYKINWQEIIYLMRKYDYCNSDDSCFHPYSPIGTSHEDHNLDWLIIKNIKGAHHKIVLNVNSDYNKLDWRFVENHLDNSADIINDEEKLKNLKLGPGRPDHAVFTAEIKIS